MSGSGLGGLRVNRGERLGDSNENQLWPILIWEMLLDCEAHLMTRRASLSAEHVESSSEWNVIS